MRKFRIVIDTSVFITALRSTRGASYKLLLGIGREKFEQNISVPLVFEYESVAKRESVDRRDMKMTTISVRLPDSLYKHIKNLAEKEGISINQFLSSAAAEKLAAFAAQEYLEKRAKRANQQKFEEALSHIPDVEPEEYDRL